MTGMTESHYYFGDFLVMLDQMKERAELPLLIESKRTCYLIRHTLA